MKQKLDLKSAIEVAIAKEMAVPDESTGLIEYRHGALLKSEDESLEKSAKSDHTEPDEDDMMLINQLAREPQEKSAWMVLRNVNPLGDPSEPDSDADIFGASAVKQMAEQAYGTPVLVDHDHSLGDKPPVGMAIRGKVSKGMLRETWAIPKEDYNANIRKGLLNGTINKISVGAFIAPADKVCNACNNGRSIYSMDCPHIPGRLDPKTGEMVTTTIKAVKRYAERSLVNIPARLGTSTGKSLASELIEIEEDLQAKSHDELLETVNSLVKATSVKNIDRIVQETIEKAFGGGAPESEITKEDSDPTATITTVINEDEVVTEKANVEAPEAQKPSEEQETPAAEAPASEEAVEQEEVKSVEVPVVKELAVEELTKSFKLEVEPVTKALAEATEKFSQLAEMQAKTDKALTELAENVTKLAEQVVRLADFSSEDAVNQILEVVGQLKEQKTEAPQVAHKSLESFVDTLRVKKQELR